MKSIGKDLHDVNSDVQSSQSLLSESESLSLFDRDWPGLLL